MRQVKPGLAYPTGITDAVVWTPAELFTGGTLGAWYDPSDTSTLFQNFTATTPVTANGDPVARMQDKSGNGNHLIQDDAMADRPLFRGKYLEFDGLNLHMYSETTPTFNQPNTLAAAVKIDSASNLSPAVFDGMHATNRHILGGHTPSLYRLFGGTTLAGGVRDTSIHTMQATINGATSFLYVDNAQVATGAGGAVAMTGIVMGHNNLKTGNQLTGRIYQAVIVNRVLTAGERASLHAYLLSKTV